MMRRRDKNIPPPIAIQSIHHEREDISREALEDFLNRRQIIGNLNPDEFDFMGDLGHGNGGSVAKVKHRPTNQVLARKVIPLAVHSSAERNSIIKELEVLKDCNSPYIVGYFGACQKRDGEMYYIHIYMEYMDGRSLDSILSKTNRIREDILGKITVSVIKGLTYLRDNLNIMHRDIKPSNILVNSHGQVKICDFGVSVQLIDSIAQTFVGTRAYMSPERLTGSVYTVQSDIWSLGLTLVELALGMYPIPQHDPLKMYEGEPSPEGKLSIFDTMDVIVNHPPPTIPGHPIFTPEFKDFVDRCLKKLPQERFDLRTIVQHKFVENSEKSHVDVDLWVCQVCLSSGSASDQ